MIEVLDGPPNVLVVRAVGKLAKDDYTGTLAPAIERLIADHGELRAAIVVGDEFEGITAGGVYEDMKTGFGNLAKWRRCAVVSNRDWARHGMDFFGWITGTDVKVFDLNELDRAIEWVAE